MNNAITGNAGANVLNGGSGADSIRGGEGNDPLNGGSGLDTLTGGTGVDRFEGSASELNGDRITDYETGERDLTSTKTTKAKRRQCAVGSGRSRHRTSDRR